MQSNLSQTYDVSFGSSLTKFNLTNYKTKSNRLKTKFSDFTIPKNPSVKQTSSNKIKYKKSISQSKNLLFLESIETQNHQKVIKKRKNKSSQPLKIHTTSQSQRQLFRFMNPQYLPRIQLKNTSKKSSVQKIIQVAKDDKKFKKFKQAYFKQIDKASKSLTKHKVSQKFPEINILGWSVKGYVIKGNLVLKAVRSQKYENSFNKRQSQKYKKIPYNDKTQHKISQNYQKFVKQWLYLDQLSNN